MFDVQRMISEFLATRAAFRNFLRSSMASHSVNFHGVFIPESLPAGLADVGPLPGVQALVDDHLVALRERLLTILARVRPRVRVVKHSCR